MTARNGSAEWHGNLESGSGTITVGEGVFEGPYSYESRFAEGEGTNPEQLIAAAHAGCFTMALSNILSAAGHAPDSVHTNARVHLRNIDGQPTLARVRPGYRGTRHRHRRGAIPTLCRGSQGELSGLARVGRDPRDRPVRQAGLGQWVAE